jgi:hypothetical protein
MRTIHRRVLRPILGAVLTGACSTTLAGCLTGASDPPGQGGPAPTAAVQPRWTSCGDAAPTLFGSAAPRSRPPLPGADPPGRSRLPGDFAATAAVLCTQEGRPPADGGGYPVATERRAADVGELVTALRLPDQPRTDNPCPAIAIHLPWFALLDREGRWTRPGVPADPCGQPRVEVREALAGLVLTQVTARPSRDTGPAGAATADAPSPEPT